MNISISLHTSIKTGNYGLLDFMMNMEEMVFGKACASFILGLFGLDWRPVRLQLLAVYTLDPWHRRPPDGSTITSYTHIYTQMQWQIRTNQAILSHFKVQEHEYTLLKRQLCHCRLLQAVKECKWLWCSIVAAISLVAAWGSVDLLHLNHMNYYFLVFYSRQSLGWNCCNSRFYKHI